MIKAIIFDCFGVLTTEAWKKFIDSLPESVDLRAVRDVHHTYTSGFITKQESASRIRELTGGPTFTEVEDLPEGSMAKNTALLDYIRQLKQRGLKIGLLSNVASPWIRDTFLAPDEQKLFDDMLFSYEVGLIKPDPRIFHLACERLGVQPSETVLVDDMERYCAAAHDEGMQFVHYQDLRQATAELEKLLAR
jgi:putative hydrolase of the HAD superfamily